MHQLDFTNGIKKEITQNFIIHTRIKKIGVLVVFISQWENSVFCRVIVKNSQLFYLIEKEEREEKGVREQESFEILSNLEEKQRYNKNFNLGDLLNE